VVAAVYSTSEFFDGILFHRMMLNFVFLFTILRHIHCTHADKTTVMCYILFTDFRRGPLGGVGAEAEWGSLSDECTECGRKHLPAVCMRWFRMAESECRDIHLLRRSQQLVCSLDHRYVGEPSSNCGDALMSVLPFSGARSHSPYDRSVE
jgi:hypothetical protein